MFFYLKVIYAKALLNLILSKDLPDIALKALEEGYDLEIFARISSSKNPTWENEGKLLIQAIEELGFEKLSIKEAAIYLTADICKQIIESKIQPYLGAKEISKIFTNLNQDNLDEIANFHYYFIEYDDYVENQKYYEGDAKYGGDYYPKLIEKLNDEIIRSSRVFLNTNK